MPLVPRARSYVARNGERPVQIISIFLLASRSRGSSLEIEKCVHAAFSLDISSNEKKKRNAYGLTDPRPHVSRHIILQVQELRLLAFIVIYYGEVYERNNNKGV